MSYGFVLFELSIHVLNCGFDDGEHWCPVWHDVLYFLQHHEHAFVLNTDSDGADARMENSIRLCFLRELGEITHTVVLT